MRGQMALAGLVSSGTREVGMYQMGVGGLGSAVRDTGILESMRS